jgi:hypothetical protein
VNNVTVLEQLWIAVYAAYIGRGYSGEHATNEADLAVKMFKKSESYGTFGAYL